MRQRRASGIRAATVGCVAAGLVLTSLVGCGGGARYRGNLTPGIMTLGGTGVQAGNKVAISRNTNLRAIWGDLARGITFQDRPSRLHPHPAPR